MSRDKIGSLPEFGSDESGESMKADKVIEAQPDGDEQEQVTPESGVQPAEQAAAGEPETETPSEPPAEETPATVEETPPSDDTENLKDKLEGEINGLRIARRELIEDIKNLRGDKREAKQAEIDSVQKEIDKLEDVDPNDLALIDRIATQRGWLRREDIDRAIFESKKVDITDRFFQQHPEYGTAEFPTEKWRELQQELSLYKEPNSSAQWSALLERAHRSVSGEVKKVQRDTSIPVKKRQAEIAGVGAGGAQRSSSVTTPKQGAMSAEQRQFYRDGGWSEEEIREMEG